VLSVWGALHPPDALICCGGAVRDTFAPLLRAPSVVVANGVDTERFHPDAGDARRYRPPGASLVIGFAGRLVPQKRPEDIIALAARMVSRHPEVRFLVAGEGSRRPDYEALLQRSNLASQVHFLGYVADMRSFYAACDIFVLPSRSEGCPNVVLESMAMRRALVVSSAAGTREVVTDGREALVFPVGDVAALAAALERLIEQPTLRQELVARAYDRVTTSFSTRVSARRLGEVLRAVMTIHADSPSRARGVTAPLPGSDAPGSLAAPALDQPRAPARPVRPRSRLAGDGRP
jgi:glycosyltransferase involved in cell wall biosynthesis